MKERMDGLDIYFIMNELKELTNSKLNKIFQTEDFFVFQFHIPNKGKKLLKIMPGFIFFIETYHAPAIIKPFCKILRKYLTNTVLEEIQQIKTERVLQFNFKTNENKYILFIELFDRGNLILCNENKKIIIPLHSQLRKDRIIKRGEIYRLPKIKKTIFEAEADDFKYSKNPISKILAVEFGLGKEYSEELCLRANIEPTKQEIIGIEINTLLQIIKELKNQKPKPVIINNIPLPIKFKKYEAKKATYIESFSKALEKIIIPVKKLTTHERKKEKIKKIIRMQEEQIKKLRKQAEENTARGEAIYHHYAMIKEILEGVNKLKKELSWHDIKERLKNNKHIKEILDKKQEIIVRL